MRERHVRSEHRVATPLELLFDLCFVVAIALVAQLLHHAVTDGDVLHGIVAYLTVFFSVWWAWMNFTWFASAYDTDDVAYRLTTLVQIAGVLVLAAGVTDAFHGHFGTVTVGYVIMRAALVTQWLRAAAGDPAGRRTARRMAAGVSACLVGWSLILLTHGTPHLVLFFVMVAAELAVPPWAERDYHTPWHPHHIAERYGLLLIITLGEVILGTVAALNAVVHGEAGWTVDAALLAIAGVGLTFGSWWMYFALPWAEPIVRHRERGFPFGYGHLLLFGALAAMGGGLHVAAYSLENESSLGATGTVLSVAIPVAVYVGVLYALYSILMRSHDPFHLGLLAGTGAVLVLSIVLAAAGVNMSVCLVVLALAPAVTVVGYEARGHRHVADALERL